ncbi:DgyrCDS8381 [Dimorphilus gyrociliatus]|uniref:Peroxisomal bifunctional enzyme n=1 Tax=Dimorphilus gyrociliatus TaxID=2664684 RepID=A0A7I8VZ40_9ANNE|nr:DgyrCDS8381 [Dimorphilus gyrociliatus]
MTEYLVEDSLATILIKNEEYELSKIYKNLLRNIKKAQNDPRVKSIVIIGQKSFTNKYLPLKLYDEDHQICLIEVLSEIENSSKPIVAAIENFCIGSGLEIAISCHYRISHYNSWFSFPEVNLGIIPQATGTQRFPRLSSLRFALDVIPSGRFFNAEEALKNNIVDKIIDSDMWMEAKKFAKQVEGKSLKERRTSKRQVIDRNKLDELILSANEKVLDYPYEKASKYGIQAVAGSVKPFDQGQMIERIISFRLFSSSQSKGLRYSDFIERSASKWQIPGGADWMNTKEDKINSIAIIGYNKRAIEIALGFVKSSISVMVASLTKRQRFIIGFQIFEFFHLSRLLQIVYCSETCPKAISTVLEAGKILNKVPLLLKSPIQTTNHSLMNSVKHLLYPDYANGKYEKNDDLTRDLYKDSRKVMICKYSPFSDNTSSYYLELEKLLDIANDTDKCQKTRLMKEVPFHKELAKWYLYNSINESFLALENGLIEKPEDIDLILLFGFNFPRQIGGLMKYADEKGPRKIYDEICKYHASFNNQPSLKPSRLLKRIALENIPMNLWSATANSISKL